MAPSSGHLLVPKVMRIVRFAVDKTSSIVRAKLSHSSATNNASIQSVRIYAQNQPAHPLAYLKQSRSQNNNRSYQTTTRAFTTVASGARSSVKYDRSRFPSSKVSRAISQLGSAPFASTLRPNLTGGALPRSAGGYSLGGSGQGARHFSHIPGAQAQVVHNVSAGIRAFFVAGGKARFDGVDPVTGEKRFRSVSATEDAVYTHWESPMSSSVKGTNLEFKISPTVTALCPSFSMHDKSSFDMTSLNHIDLLSTLTSDFARAVQDLSLILSDLRALSTFGDLPISLADAPTGPILIVRFPGCDSDLVSRLCDEVGVKRGVVVEDEGWHGASFGEKAGQAEKDVEMALLFPFAPNGTSSYSLSPSEKGEDFYFGNPTTPRRKIQRQQKLIPEPLDWRNMLSPSQHTTESLLEHLSVGQGEEDMTLRSSSPPPPIAPHAHHHHSHSPPMSGYESLRESDFASENPYFPTDTFVSSPIKNNKSAAAAATTPATTQAVGVGAGGYEGVEGIYKFLQVCEEAETVRVG